MHKRISHRVLGLGVAAVLLSCNPTADDNRSAVVLTLALAGSTETEDTGFLKTQQVVTTSGLFSDVVDDNGNAADDFLRFRLESIPKSPVSVLSDFYTVQLTGYQVVFSRADGFNTPGIDVPFPLTLPISAQVPPGGAAEVDLLLITREMKLESPLRDLWFGDGQRIFVSANLTIFGTDLLGNAVTASGTSLVAFGDF